MTTSESRAVKSAEGGLKFVNNIKTRFIEKVDSFPRLPHRVQYDWKRRLA